MQAWQQCVDVPAYASRCEELASTCRNERGSVARRICPKTCGTCMGQGAYRLHAREAVLLEELSALDDGASMTVETLAVGTERTPVLVVDNLLPASVVDYAALTLRESRVWQPAHPETAQHWPSPDGRGAPRDANGLFAVPGRLKDTFPGLMAPLSDEYERLVWARLRQLKLGTRFADLLAEYDSPLRSEWENAFHGLVCYSPHHLHPGQRSPHVDMSGKPKLAMVHHLTDWRAAEADGAPSGGTSFYREKETQAAHFGPRRCEALGPTHGGSHFCKDSLAYNCSRKRAPPEACRDLPNSMSTPAASAYRLARPSFMSDSDDYFELLRTVPPVYNRAIIYSARQLHNAYLDDAAVSNLSCSPALGRLTANLFIA